MAENEKKAEALEAEAEQNTVESSQEAQEQPKDSLPEWAQSQLEKARKEAASYRTQLREAQEQLGQAKSEEEFNKVVSELNSKLAERERELVLERYGISEEESSLVVGDGVEDWEAKAKLIQSLKKTAEPAKVEPPATDRPPKGGRESSRETSGTVDPMELARRARARR